MRERLLNPKKKDINLKNLEIITIDGVSYRMFSEVYSSIDSGTCQCNKDCDCSSKTGLITNKKVNWYRNVKFDGTDKCFYSEPYTPKNSYMKNKYVIIDLRNMDYMKDENGKINYYDTEEEAAVICGMYEFENAWICKLIFNHIEINN